MPVICFCVNHDLLMHLVSRKVHDKRVLSLIGRYLRAGVKVNGRLEKSRLGVPLGQGGELRFYPGNLQLCLRVP